jgi:predicted aspartyl protease
LPGKENIYIHNFIPRMRKRGLYGILVSAVVLLPAALLSFSPPVLLPESISPIPDELETDAPVPVMPPETNELTIPLKSAGRLFLIEAVIDGVNGNLIFDTGASRLVLNKTYFRKHLTGSGQPAQGITGSVASAEKVLAGSITISGLKYSKIAATVADLSHIENRRGIKVLGLFGFQLLKSFETELNLTENELIIRRVDQNKQKSEASGTGTQPGITLPATVKNNILFITGSVAGNQMRFCIDTGAEISSIDSHSPKSVLNSLTIERTSNLTGAGSIKSEVVMGRIKKLNFGSTEIANMPFIIANLNPLTEVYGIKTDGMLGYDFVMKGRLRINFKSGEITLRLNKKEQ